MGYSPHVRSGPGLERPLRETRNPSPSFGQSSVTGHRPMRLVIGGLELSKRVRPFIDRNNRRDFASDRVAPPLPLFAGSLRPLARRDEHGRFGKRKSPQSFPPRQKVCLEMRSSRRGIWELKFPTHRERSLLREDIDRARPLPGLDRNRWATRGADRLGRSDHAGSSTQNVIFPSNCARSRTNR